MKRKAIILIFVFFISQQISVAQPQPLAGCTPPTAKTYLDISNVRAMLLTGGDMWWDLSNAQYEVPKGSGKNSMFAGAIWIGGLDAATNLHVAAQNYRQGGNEFWAGPLDTTNADVTPVTCSQFDKHWKINRQDVLNFIAGGAATADMISYPGNGTGNQAHYLAPFFDKNADGIYNTADGDYPLFDYVGSASGGCNNTLHGDQALWWVINDMGNLHTNTGGSPFGMEIQCQAFAYLSADADINNTTFYQYRIINRSSTSYNQMYFGQWADPDLGNALDDFVGCDVKRGMGYCYNSDEDDETSVGYGINPPAIGIDFIQGPLADAGDGIDNNRDSVIDEAGEQIIMSKFVYYLNGAPNGMADPQNAPEFYNYLRGYWQDGTVFLFGGNGKGGGMCSTTTPCSFMFPGTSDPYGWGTNGVITQANNSCWGWQAESAGQVGDDRRFMQSAGPFTMLPGSVHDITVATVWARATSGGRLASVALLKSADDKVQYLADSCFKGSLMTNISSPLAASSVSVYPNPSNGIFTITFPQDVKSGEVTVYNIAGEKVYEQKFTNLKQQIVNCKLSSGIYFIKVSDRERTVTKKLVVE